MFIPSKAPNLAMPHSGLLNPWKMQLLSLFLQRRERCRFWRMES
jgi:hypothetical protein